MNTSAQLVRPRTCATRIFRDESGTSAVEFALIAPLLLFLVGGLVDLTRFISQRTQLDAAAQAGADYARAHGWDSAGIQTAVTGATSLAGVSAPAPQLATACVSGQTLAPTTAGACPAGGPPGRFVTVQATKPFTRLTPLTGLVLPSTITSTALVRLQ